MAKWWWFQTCVTLRGWQADRPLSSLEASSLTASRPFLIGCFFYMEVIVCSNSESFWAKVSWNPEAIAFLRYFHGDSRVYTSTQNQKSKTFFETASFWGFKASTVLCSMISLYIGFCFRLDRLLYQMGLPELRTNIFKFELLCSVLSGIGSYTELFYLLPELYELDLLRAYVVKLLDCVSALELGNLRDV